MVSIKNIGLSDLQWQNFVNSNDDQADYNCYKHYYDGQKYVSLEFKEGVVKIVRNPGSNLSKENLWKIKSQVEERLNKFREIPLHLVEEEFRALRSIHENIIKIKKNGRHREILSELKELSEQIRSRLDSYGNDPRAAKDLVGLLKKYKLIIRSFPDGGKSSRKIYSLEKSKQDDFYRKKR